MVWIMFTGIVKDIGTIESIRRQGSNLRICVRYENEHEFGDLAIDESVAINGTCQTVVALGEKRFDVNTIEETLKKTTLGTFAPGISVNLERALRPSDRLGGHFVQGHVDCVGNVLQVRELEGSREIRIGFPEKFQPFIVPIGSIAINGVSLTVADVRENSFSVAIIPYTFDNTTINHLNVGDGVNLEFDILGKYIVKQQELVKNVTSGAGKISESWLSDLGY